ncbi:36295_t:CDS:2 [Gigaspora margarita]|uniref:36295_t:CDS:1 n=1 Tax=Gigaspora margarita TaxID=4874 RepID=A0ABN7V7I7_GIGMA|nr:36295_t:CDS:2 [Gigaspora margarita]
MNFFDWKDLGYFAQKCKERILHFCYYDANKKPFDLSYVQGLDTPMLWWESIKSQPNHLSELAQRLFSISPSQANCKRKFSTLKWFIEDK